MSNINRRKFLSSSIFGTLTIALPIAKKVSGKTDQRPNILWITSEDNSPLLGCYGDPFATTPNLDKFASEGVLYENAFANIPVCAPTRSTIITGMYACSMGTHNMRSRNAIPEFLKMYPDTLRKSGYYCTNHSKTDFNIAGDDKSHWDACSQFAHFQNRKPDQPFFSIFNLTISHEGQLHKGRKKLRHDPAKVTLPPYHPDTPEIRYDWARYYDLVEDMDSQVGEILNMLDNSGQAENTIVFYYSDHGGVLARSKRFIYETGTHVPMIIRFPEKYQHLAPDKAGTHTDRLVSFVDLAPTLLSLAGISIPDYMQGEAFLGKQQKAPREYAFLFRNRMDERFDMMRSARDKQFQYIRNYYPYRIYGQHLNYLWKAPSTRSWEKEFKEGRCNDVQSRFWGIKAPEELYDVKNDPWEIHNLADDPKYKSILERMRNSTKEWCQEIKDAGFLVEGEMMERAKNTTIYEFVHSGKVSMDEIIEAADLASSATKKDISKLVKILKNNESFVRYWGAVGLLKLGVGAKSVQPALETALHDSCPDVRIIAAEALCKLGQEEAALTVLEQELQGPNPKTILAALNALEYIGEPTRKILSAVKKVPADFNDDYTTRASEHLLAQFEE